jgi:hypothetical protein
MMRSLARPALARSALGACTLAIWVLAACSSSPPATTLQGRCEQQAADDPSVKAIQVDAPTRSGDLEWQADLVAARHKAVTACLAAAGIVQRGGVEPVGRLHYGAGWF